MLGVRFLVSEYSTGPVHGGRIDTLGIDENGAPVVIEFKRATDAGVINQGLFYLSWLVDHKAEYGHLVRDRLGAPAAAQILWSAPRLICVAGNFTRYDVHAIREHRRSIDLVRYRFFGEDHFGLETVASVAAQTAALRTRRASETRAPGPRVAESAMEELHAEVDQVLLGLGDDITKVQRKTYRAYQRLRNFACVCPPQGTNCSSTSRPTPKRSTSSPDSPGT
ncbi:transporter [Streptomyces klenkii]